MIALLYKKKEIDELKINSLNKGMDSNPIQKFSEIEPGDLLLEYQNNVMLYYGYLFIYKIVSFNSVKSILTINESKQHIFDYFPGKGWSDEGLMQFRKTKPALPTLKSLDKKYRCDINHASLNFNQFFWQMIKKIHYMKLLEI
jgi:hypothetical protein